VPDQSEELLKDVGLFASRIQQLTFRALGAWERLARLGFI